MPDGWGSARIWSGDASVETGVASGAPFAALGAPGTATILDEPIIPGVGGGSSCELTQTAPRTAAVSIHYTDGVEADRFPIASLAAWVTQVELEGGPVVDEEYRNYLRFDVNGGDPDATHFLFEGTFHALTSWAPVSWELWVGPDWAAPADVTWDGGSLAASGIIAAGGNAFISVRVPAPNPRRIWFWFKDVSPTGDNEQALAPPPVARGFDGAASELTAVASLLDLTVTGINAGTFELWDRILSGALGTSTDGHPWTNGTEAGGIVHNEVTGTEAIIHILSGATLNQGTAWVNVGPGQWTHGGGFEATGTWRVDGIAPDTSRVYWRLELAGHGVIESPYAGGDLNADEWLFQAGSTVYSFDLSVSAAIDFADGSLWHYRWHYDYVGGFNRIRFWRDTEPEPITWTLQHTPHVPVHSNNLIGVISRNESGGSGKTWNLHLGPICFGAVGGGGSSTPDDTLSGGIQGSGIGR